MKNFANTTKTAADSEAAKRPKLGAHASTASSGTGSSVASQHDDETPTGRMRLESSTPGADQWHTGDGASSPQLSAVPKLSLALGGPKRQGSPNTTSPAVLPGYRDSIYGAPQQALPWRDNQRDDSLGSLQQLSRVATGGDRRPSYTESPSEKLNLTGSMQHAHRTGQSHPPPLLTSESTNRSSVSSGSTVSSTYFTPRTPMEPPLERALPIPSLYPQKSNGNFDHQLPPLRPPSLSPRSIMLASQQSPQGMPTMSFISRFPVRVIVPCSMFPLPLLTVVQGVHSLDFPSSMAPLRSYTATAPQQIAHDDQSEARHRDLMSSTSGDDNILDPVSALLRAGEIVNRNSRGRPSS